MITKTDYKVTVALFLALFRADGRLSRCRFLAELQPPLREAYALAVKKFEKMISRR